ncbi:hypothetical protein K9F62_03005 [Desulfovibrio sp. JY]|nr:hypothetical protein K9F62_03005 [Desulfovibrio sp. JY]
MATQDDLFFRGALRRKQAIQQQQADTATQDVTQRPEMQARSDAAAMDRAQIGAQTQLSATDMTNQSQASRAAAANATQMNIASLQDQGASARTGMQTGTQMAIAGMEDRTKRTQLAEESYLKRQALTRPTTIYDQDGMRTSAPGVDFSQPGSVGIESPLDEDARRRRAAAAGIQY